jgi:hypothetical protein
VPSPNSERSPNHRPLAYFPAHNAFDPSTTLVICPSSLVVPQTPFGNWVRCNSQLPRCKDRIRGWVSNPFRELGALQRRFVGGVMQRLLQVSNPFRELGALQRPRISFPPLLAILSFKPLSGIGCVAGLEQSMTDYAFAREFRLHIVIRVAKT